MVYALGLSLIVAQAVYIRFLFEGFRHKVYLDVMDFLIDRKKKEKEVLFGSDTVCSKVPHLKLVHKEDR